MRIPINLILGKRIKYSCLDVQEWEEAEVVEALLDGWVRVRWKDTPGKVVLLNLDQISRIVIMDDIEGFPLELESG